MKHRKLKTYAVLLLNLVLQATQAQTTMLVKQKVGTNTSFNLSTLKSLTFVGDNVTVNKKDASTNSFLRSNVQYIGYGVNTVIAPINEAVNTKLRLFPNPVLDVLNVAFTETNSKPIQIEILGIDGRVALRSVLQNSISSISVAALLKGLYLLRINNGTSTESSKFIKL